MFESLILGAVQGIAEWLPISSEAMVVLVKNNFFSDGMAFSEMISFAIFLHLGTLLAAVVYFRTQVWRLIKRTFLYNKATSVQRNELRFIFLATLVSGLIGVILLKFVEQYESFFHNITAVNLFVALFLVITAVLLWMSESRTEQREATLTPKRAFITGIFQGFAAIPGISRSGSTIAGMGLLGIDKERALELSFILSIPLVFFANIILNFDTLTSLTINHIVALVSAFFFGIITIELLLRLVKKIRFSYFVGIFALLLLIFTLAF